MINLTEESGPSHDIRTESKPPRLVAGAVALEAYLNLSSAGVPKNVVDKWDGASTQRVGDEDGE